jgi:GT2 family glycosyltransferase
MYLREAFLDVGGFDEDFFSYFEDVDLGFRLLLRGYRCMYVPEALVHHVGSASLGLRSDFAFYHTQRNLIWTYFKNMPAGLLWLYMPQHVLLNLTYLIYYTLLGRGKVLWKAKWDAMLGLPKALEKRRAIQRVRRFSNDDLRHRMEHGWLQPYRLSAKLRKTLQNNRMERS